MLASVVSNSSCCLVSRAWKLSIRRCAASASVVICSTSASSFFLFSRARSSCQLISAMVRSASLETGPIALTTRFSIQL